MTGRWRYLALAPGALAAPVMVALGIGPLRDEAESAIWITVYLAWFAAGAVAFVRRPGHRAAERLLLTGTAMIFWGVLGFSVVRVLHDGGLPSPFSIGLLTALDLLIPASVLALLAVYPNGEYGRAFERRLVHIVFVLVVVLPFALQLTRATVPEPTFVVWLTAYAGDWPDVASQIDIDALHVFGGLAGGLAPLTFNLCLAAAVAVFVLHYRRATAAERVQLTWPLSMVVIGALIGSSELLLFLWGVDVPVVGWLNGLSTAAVPVFVAIGLLRPDLFDIQRVMRRSLLYGALWIAIGALYLGVAAAVGIAAAQAHVEVAVAVSIIATLLFQPARRLAERRARRFVFGSHVSRDELLRRFGQTLEHTLEPSELTAAVAATVHEALLVAWVRIRIDGEVTAAYGIAPDDRRPPATSADLGLGLGSVECGPRAHGRWTTADRELLDALGRQTGLALRNARLAEALREHAESLAASRARIVAAEDNARRGIERDIHDGVQQELVALIARIALARNQLSRDPSLVDETLVEVQAEAVQALDDLRELARGIHPSVLSDRGIVDAIEGRAARLPLGVTIECDPMMRGQRFPEPVEAAVYFLVSEGFTNAVKHSRAERVIVRLREQDGGLEVEVSDDGVGFDVDATELGGLRGLADRFDALDGTMGVVSSPGAGTRIHARLGTDDRARV